MTAAGDIGAEAPDHHLERIASWMAGSFDTFQQVAEDQAARAGYVHLRAVMHIAPVALPWLTDGDRARAFYVEQAAADTEDRPYRQRLYLLTTLNGALVNRIYRIHEPADLVGAHVRSELLARLSPERVRLEEGCDLVWVPVDEYRYQGVTGLRGGCPSGLRGATHTISLVELTADHILSLDQGFDDTGAHRWGPPPGTVGHFFRRRGAPGMEAAQALVEEFAALRAGGADAVYWYVEGAVHVVGGDGRLSPHRGVVGFNVAQLESGDPGGDLWLRSHELFFTTDLERTTLELDHPPIRNRVDFAMGVRDGQALAGIGFAVNGRPMAEAVAPVPIQRVVEDGRIHFFTQPFVNARIDDRRWWAAELYQFTAKADGDGGGRLLWQRDNELPGIGRVHWAARGFRVHSLEEMARLSPMAARVAELVRDRYPESAQPPRRP